MKGKKSKMEYEKVSSAPFSKKLMNGCSFSGANIYDGFLSGPMKVDSCVEEDFGEIFRGPTSSSIPVLDVPELNERKISVHVNSSELDYSKIFGGFGEFDFAVSHEDISVKSKKRDIKEARTPAETGPGSHTFNFSVENHIPSNEASFQSFDGVKQFKMSYHKANQERRNGTNGATHVTQLHAVPGYTCLIDESASSKNTEGDKPLSSALNGIHLKTNFSGEMMEGKHSCKASSVHSVGGASKQASRDGVKIQNKFNHSRSNTSDVFFDAFEIGLKAHPSKVLPPSCRSDDLGNNKGDSMTSMGTKTGISNIYSTEGATGVCSPPYFDEEVDTNSVAAASAAALKKAIEDAQAKIKITKEIMERKKDGLQNHVKLGFNDGPKVEKRREVKITDETKKFRAEWQKCRKGNAPMQVFAKEMHNVMKAGKVAPDFRERDGQLFAKEISHGTLGYKNNSTIMDLRQEEMRDLKEEKCGGIATKLVQSVNDLELTDRFFTMKMFEKSEETGKKLKAFEEAHQQEVERTLNAVQGTCELKEDVCEPKSGRGAYDQEEYGKNSMVSGLQEGKDVTFETSCKVEAREKKQRRLWDLTGNILVMQLKDNEHTKMRMLEEEQAWSEHEKKQKEVLEQKESDIRSENFPETEENEVALEEIFDPKENGKRDEATCEKVEFEKQQKESCRLEEKEEGLEDVHEREDAEYAYDKAQEQGNVKVTINGFQDGEWCRNKLEEDVELGANGKLIEADEIDKRLEESLELGETEEIQREIDEREEDEKMKITQEACEHFEDNHEVDVCTQDKTEFLNKTLATSVNDENDPYLVIPTHEENGRLTEVSRASFKRKEKGTESNVVDLANDQEEKRILEVEISGLAQVVLELHNEIWKQVKDTTMVHASEHHGLNIGVSDMEGWKKSSDLHKKEFDTCCNTGNCVEESTSESEENFEDVEETMIQGEDESNSQFPHEERWIDYGENVEATQEENFEEAEEAMKQGEDVSNSEFSLEEKWIDNGETVEATQQGKEESIDTVHKVKTNQSTEHNKEDHSEILKTVVREAECTMQREVELQKAHERKLDEAKEKEREREKERIAVERAICEAHERAFTEAREKANAEARQRAMANARERLEKATAEVSDKSATDKISMEARLKAERAAVERATAEARVRALEKAMSEKATSQRRNQAVRSSGASRENGVRHSCASNYKGSDPSRSSVYPNSSSHEVNSESIQRYKTRLESYQQIAERAANALAEKNLRDQLARKEQVERNRLAGVLDAEVKRWSSGKAGNLRALLSTLQYILGPDSGWQPIPLTDLMATAAVKKAYRKATLCVHPDKLQQRGANIQQKYICEKVFDLLKEAWNKFNAVER